MFRSSMLTKSVVMGLAIVLVAGSASYAQGRRGGNSGFGGFGRGASKTALLASEQVRKELKVTEEQVAKIKEITDASRAGFDRNAFSGLRELPEEERRKKFAELREKMTKAAAEVGEKVAAVLNETQSTRLDQILLQQQGVGALTSKDTAAKLSITKEQQQQIKDLMDAQREMTRELSSGFSGFRGLRELPEEERAAKLAELRKKGEEARKKGEEIRTETNKAVMAVLTASQKTQFEQLKGAEFKLERRSRRPGQGGQGGNRRPGQGNGNRRPQNTNN